MVQFLSNFFPWISSIFVGFFKSSRFFCVTLYIPETNHVPREYTLSSSLLSFNRRLFNHSHLTVTRPTSWYTNCLLSPVKESIRHSAAKLTMANFLNCLCTAGYRVSFLVIKRKRRGVNHAPQFSAKAKRKV